MGLDALYQRCVYAADQLWAWLGQETGLHPAMFLGAVIVIAAAIILYKTEVRGR